MPAAIGVIELLTTSGIQRIDVANYVFVFGRKLNFFVFLFDVQHLRAGLSSSSLCSRSSLYPHSAEAILPDRMSQRVRVCVFY